MRKKKYKDIQIGDIFGKLTVVSYDGKHEDGRHYWNCKCSCNGNIKSYKKENLNNGNTTSCGCLRSLNNTTNNNIDYTGRKNDYGVELIKPLFKNIKKQWIWECKCGYCGNYFESIPARVFNNHVKSCGCLLSKNFDKRNTVIKYSFEDWCNDNNHNDYLELWDYQLNKKIPSEISYGATSKYYFKCKEDNTHPSQAFNIAHITNRNDKIKCKYCNSFAKWGIDNIGQNFIKEYWDSRGNIGINPYLLERGSGRKIKIKCQEKEYHGSYLITPNHFINGGRCPYCNKNSGKIHPLDSLGNKYPQINDLWSTKNNKTPYNYSPTCNKKIWLKCSCGIHKDYRQAITNAIRADFRCPECSYHDSISRLQHKVSNYFKEKYSYYTVLHENKCYLHPVNPLTNYPMKYDNEIKELKLIIEIHGIQHYEVTWFHKKQSELSSKSPKQLLEEQKTRDQIKKEYALNNGYEYMVISYLDEKNDKYKKLIDDVILKITNNN